MPASNGMTKPIKSDKSDRRGDASAQSAAAERGVVHPEKVTLGGSSGSLRG